MGKGVLCEREKYSKGKERKNFEVYFLTLPSSFWICSCYDFGHDS
jgi:hypothetical protein